MPTWPASLPQAILAGGVTVGDEDAVLRTQMDTGPASRRNRFTAVSQNIKSSIRIRGAQYQTLQTFYRETLRNGAFSFDWVHPVTGQLVVYAFSSPPEYSIVSPDPDPDERLWDVSLSLEVLP